MERLLQLDFQRFFKRGTQTIDYKKRSYNRCSNIIKDLDETDIKSNREYFKSLTKLLYAYVRYDKDFTLLPYLKLQLKGFLANEKLDIDKETQEQNQIK